MLRIVGFQRLQCMLVVMVTIEDALSAAFRDAFRAAPRGFAGKSVYKDE